VQRHGGLEAEPPKQDVEDCILPDDHFSAVRQCKEAIKQGVLARSRAAQASKEGSQFSKWMITPATPGPQGRLRSAF
jgi:hypothetical protein